MPSVFSSILWGIITLSIVVFVHEGGHFLAARACGLQVDEFMLGLPGPKISWKWGHTRYGITAIPFGGYVRIPALEGAGAAGELGAMTEEERVQYAAVPTYKRVVTLAAGIVFNLVTALVVFTLVLTLWGTYTEKGVRVVGDGPLAQAYVAAGGAEITNPTDNTARALTLTAIDGVPVHSMDDASRLVGKHTVGDRISVTVESTPANRDRTVSGDARNVDVTLGTNPNDPTRAYLGVSPEYARERLPLLKAAGQSFEYLRLTAAGILRLFRPSTFSQTVNQSSSVIGISVIAAEAAKSGPMEYASLIAAISLSLGLMNLLPIPPLDGGKILIEVIQKIIRRPLKQGVVIATSLAGFAVLIVFMGYVMYNDIARLITR